MVFKPILEILPKNEGYAYAPLRIYLPTKALSGDCFVRYNLVYEYNDTRDNYAPNSTANVSNYRIREAQLVRVKAVSEAFVESEALFEVLQQGEISLAIREDLAGIVHLAPGAKPIEKNGECYAADFIGGFHGDERLTSVTLTADGTALDLTATVPCALFCEAIDFNLQTILYRWGTSNADSYGIPVAEHTQRICFSADGLKNHQSVRWLRGDFHVRKNATFLQMFTMRREQNGIPICETFEAFDENGASLGCATLPIPTTEGQAMLHNPDTRLVRYSSATSGISGEVGFRILRNSLQTDRTWVQVRAKPGDNKWYASFSSPENGRVPREGELWEIELFAHIDYEG